MAESESHPPPPPPPPSPDQPPATPPTASASAAGSHDGATPRCPRCLYPLWEQPSGSPCPECGTVSASAERFHYLHQGGFFRTTVLFLWPVLLTPVFLAGMSGFPAAGVLSIAALLALVVNSSYVSYGVLRRARVRKLRTTDVAVESAGLWAASIGCGVVASIAVFVLVFAVSCGGLLLFMLH